VGCGANYSEEWTNVDLNASDPVIHHDAREPLPFGDASFAAVYSSHVLEHLDPARGRALIKEMARVLSANGVVRVAVPDLEGLCRAYLARLEEAIDDPRDDALKRYRWSVIELIDQMVRDTPGGQMLEILERREFDREYVASRCGDEFAQFYDGAPATPQPPPDPGEPPATGGLLRAVKRVGRANRAEPRAETAIVPSPRETGEAHRWMYDRLSLKLLLESEGFVRVKQVSHDESAIPDWSRYRLDTSQEGDRPRKPDSLFVEAIKPS
jgi:predicted SAM-dependent methyltransferase